MSSKALQLEAPRKNKLILFLIVACLIHLLFFCIHLPRPFTRSPLTVQTIDPSTLDTIKKKWKEKALLINPDSKLKHEKKPPPNARYFSDRNTSTQKEQRAKNDQMAFPKQKKTPSVPLSLKTLGIAFHLNDPKPETQSDFPDSNQTGAQPLYDQNIPMGSETILNTEESHYYSFYARIYTAIGPIWRNETKNWMRSKQLHPGEYKTHVEIILDEQGNLQAIKKIGSSGIDFLDESVFESWKKIERFPNPPRGLLDKEQQVHMLWTFEFHITEARRYLFLPPEREN